MFVCASVCARVCVLFCGGLSAAVHTPRVTMCMLMCTSVVTALILESGADTSQVRSYLDESFVVVRGSSCYDIVC